MAGEIAISIRYATDLSALPDAQAWRVGAAADGEPNLQSAVKGRGVRADEVVERQCGSGSLLEQP
jgi:hypothetical protein